MHRAPPLSVRLLVPAISLLVSCAALPALAEDHFLTIGGGDRPDKTQVSLEKNVLYVQKILAEFGIPAGCQDVFFSDGPDRGRDVQFHDPAIEVPKLNRLLAQVFGKEAGIDNQYRTQQIPSVRGPTTRQELAKWFDTVGAKLPADDRLFIYYTGHGGGGTPPRNTTLVLWGENAMPVKEFVGLLDKLPPKLRVVLVMVQCHAGGFADVIFKDGQTGSDVKKLSPADRCGFYATVHDRPAAGCTPDIDEENYHEYSTYFWAALCGHTRTGATVEGCDYDGDGHVSLAEAHAYVQLTSDTIDIPVSTSDALLRAFGNTKGADALTAESPYDRVAAAATPCERAVLEGLTKKLELFGPDRVKAARKLAEKLEGERKDFERQSRAASKDANANRDRIKGRVTARWPELANPYHPRVAQIVREESDALVKAIESHEAFGKFEEFRERSGKLDDKARDLERKWVKCQRLIRTAEDVALAASFERVAPKEAFERYRQLVEAEGGTVGKRAGE